MATSTSSRPRSARPSRATRAKKTRAETPRAGKARRPTKVAKRHRTEAKRGASHPATAVLKSFAKLLTSVRASAATLTPDQRVLLKRAMKHAHAALG